MTLPASLRMCVPCMQGIARIDVLGCPFDVISFDDTMRVVERAVRGGERCQIVPGSVDTVMKSRANPDFAARLRRCDLVIADGNFIAWAAALLGTPLRGRVSGTELAWQCAAVARRTGRALALVGGVARNTVGCAEKMRAAFPGARVDALDTPFPLDAAASEKVVEEIRRLEAAIVLVALGAPRQELWVETYLQASGAAVGVGIGSAFDILSGDKPRAPLWMQQLSLEWLFRMLLEPRRLGRRYLVEDMPFVGLLAREILRRKTARR